jgi:hypothetical protein
MRRNAARNRPLQTPPQRETIAALLTLGLLVGSLYLLTATYTVAQNNDTRAAAMGSWSLGTRGDHCAPSRLARGRDLLARCRTRRTAARQPFPRRDLLGSSLLRRR